jgi:DNA-binding NarL/FixJ family response regulator
MDTIRLLQKKIFADPFYKKLRERQTDNKVSQEDEFDIDNSKDEDTSVFDPDNISLEERIKALENQSNNLLYFVFFMYENFPELVKKILPQNQLISLLVNPAAIKQSQKTEPSVNAGKALHSVDFKITPREMEVLQLLADGLCAKEIAGKLFISESTVVTHKKNLKEKFEARNSAELISKATLFLIQ